MSARFLLIDGYNLLHAAGMAPSYIGPGDLLRCRGKLLHFLLSKLSAAEVAHTTVIFDARDPPPDRPARTVVAGLQVEFASPGGDADVAIGHWLERHPHPRQVTLISGDRALQRAARGVGAQFLASAAFLGQLERRRRSEGRTSSRRSDDDDKPSGAVSTAQAAYWMQVFGDVTVVEPSGDEPGPAAPASEASAAGPTSRAVARGRRRRRPKAGTGADKPRGNLPPDELAYWLTVFSDVPGAASERPARKSRLAELEEWLKEYERSGPSR